MWLLLREEEIELEGKKEKGGVLGSDVKFGGWGLAYNDHGRNVHIYIYISSQPWCDCGLAFFAFDGIIFLGFYHKW